MAFDTDDHIRVRAYHLWEASGRPEGRDREFWEQARKASEGAATAKPKRRATHSQAAGTTAASSSKRTRRAAKSRSD